MGSQKRETSFHLVVIMEQVADDISVEPFTCVETRAEVNEWRDGSWKAQITDSTREEYPCV